MSDVDKWYRDYWKRLQAREKLNATLRAPCVNWYWSEDFNPVERLIYGRAKDAHRILDYGAGEERLKRKFITAGFTGQYDTFDLSSEHEHTYGSRELLQAGYDAIFCLEVVEHMTLNDYVNLMDEFDRLLAPGGLLVVSTPNPLCIVPMWSLDAGHIQQFPLADLAADFVVRGYEIEAFRMRLGSPDGVRRRVRLLLQRALCYLLSTDYAHGQVIMGRKRQ